MGEYTFTLMKRTVADLSEANEEDREFYIPAEGGGFRLHPELEVMVDAHDAKALAHIAELEKMDARAEKRTALLHKLVATEAARVAFENAGVPLTETHKAAEFFCRRFKLNVELDDDYEPRRVTMADGFGEIGVEAAVQAFLTTREGDLFSGGPKARDQEGP